MGLNTGNFKKGSKRKTLKLRATINKKASVAKKKLKKLSKSAGYVKRSARRDPGIPNSYPFKAQLLTQIARQKEEETAEKLAKRKAKREALAAVAGEPFSSTSPVTSSEIEATTATDRKRKFGEQPGEAFDHTELAEMLSVNTGKAREAKQRKTVKETPPPTGTSVHRGTLSDLKRQIDTKSEVWDKSAAETASTTGKEDAQGSAPSAFFKELTRVINESDVVLEILDARDPLGCRSQKIEDLVLSHGKKLVFVLNKIDLVPNDVARKWLNHLRRIAPTVAFKSLVSKSGRVKGTANRGDALNVSEAQAKANTQVLGASSLLELLKNYSRVEGGRGLAAKKAVVVGLVGCPNVGKSSVINSMKRDSTAVKVGAEAGVTRSLQYITLDKKVKLIDSPGVVFTGNEHSDAGAILRNAVKISDVKDPVSVVSVMLEKVTADVLMRLFKIPFYKTSNEFLTHVARARGRLNRGGVPDVDAAARHVLTEWNSGKIRHYSLPPEPTEAVSEAVLLTKLSEPFLDKLWSKNDEDLVAITDPGTAFCTAPLMGL